MDSNQDILTMRTPSLRTFLLPLMILAVGIGGGIYLKATRSQQKQPQPQEKIWQVAVTPLTSESLAPEITLFATVTAPERVRAEAPANGVVAATHYREGEQVSAGEEILTLDRRDFQSRITSAEADIAEIEAQIRQQKLKHQFNRKALQQEEALLNLARSALKRAEKLQQQNLGSDASLDEAHERVTRQELVLAQRRLEVEGHETTLQQLQAKLNRAAAQLADAQLAEERSRVIAPYDLTIAALPVAVGERVQSGEVMVEYYAPDRLRLEAAIARRYLERLQPALAQGEKILGHSGALQLRLTGFSGTSQPGTVTAFFEIETRSHPLRPGEVAELRLTLPTVAELFALPPQALYGSDTIYLVESGALRATTISVLGNRSAGGNNSILVRHHPDHPPLQEGALVMTTHLPNAITGLKVGVKQP
ncbi:MAG: HlyD family efflux transporter periplasmic adaptor subunit [Gammaproteobacteria bacterium]|nr:HlyD family efflux transporter periplasmic adaptor subunit [Gammaproteobacteria bacterium]